MLRRVDVHRAARSVDAGNAECVRPAAATCLNAPWADRSWLCVCGFVGYVHPDFAPGDRVPGPRRAAHPVASATVARAWEKARVRAVS